MAEVVAYVKALDSEKMPDRLREVSPSWRRRLPRELRMHISCSTPIAANDGSSYTIWFSAGAGIV
jgi:hypothetical protein